MADYKDQLKDLAATCWPEIAWEEVSRGEESTVRADQCRLVGHLGRRDHGYNSRMISWTESTTAHVTITAQLGRKGRDSTGYDALLYLVIQLYVRHPRGDRGKVQFSVMEWQSDSQGLNEPALIANMEQAIYTVRRTLNCLKGLLPAEEKADGERTTESVPEEKGDDTAVIPPAVNLATCATAAIVDIVTESLDDQATHLADKGSPEPTPKQGVVHQNRQRVVLFDLPSYGVVATLSITSRRVLLSLRQNRDDENAILHGNVKTTPLFHERAVPPIPGALQRLCRAAQEDLADYRSEPVSVASALKEATLGKGHEGNPLALAQAALNQDEEDPTP